MKPLIIKTIVIALASVGLGSLPAGIALANPQGGTVVAGTVAIQQESATKLGVTQTSNKAIVDWRSFSIGANEQTQFYQPSASSVILNRVVGEDPSKILGTLTANGQVFLVNPNGILFGKNAQIDVAGLVATTHNIRNEDFLAGKYNFNIPGKPNASVINEGTIRIADTGIAAFLAPSVANKGVIVARLGKVALGAANGFTLDFQGDELLSFMVSDEVAQTAYDLDGNQLTSFVENAGRIEAHGGHVLLTAKAAEGVVQGVINQSGVIEAVSVGVENGEIILSGGQHGTVSISGTLDVSGKNQGETGGVVKITGQDIHLTSSSRVDASGAEGGGKVFIGGDNLEAISGNTPLTTQETHSASASTLSRSIVIDGGTVIDASALSNGSGGVVLLWSDESSKVHGMILANGGQNSGDGGFIETSSKHSVDIADANISAAAFNGQPGTWLLDPDFIWIDSSAAAAIKTALNNGTHHKIIATYMVDIAADITKTSGGDATLYISADWIYQHEGVDVTSTAGKLNINYDAKDRVWIGRGWVGGESNFNTNGGNIIFNGPNFVGVNGTINAGTGTILIKAQNKEPVGFDKGIWIFGNSKLIGSKVTLLTADSLRRVDSANAIVIQQVANLNILLSTQTANSTSPLPIITNNNNEITAQAILMLSKQFKNDLLPNLASITKKIATTILEGGVVWLADDGRTAEIFNLIFNGNITTLSTAERLNIFEAALNDPQFMQELNQTIINKFGLKLATDVMESITKALIIKAMTPLVAEIYGQKQADYFEMLAPHALHFAEMAASSGASGLFGTALYSTKIWVDNLKNFTQLGVDLARARESGNDLTSAINNALKWNTAYSESLISNKLTGDVFGDQQGKPLTDKQREIFIDILKQSPSNIEDMVFAENYLKWVQNAAESFAVSLESTPQHTGPLCAVNPSLCR